MFGSLDSDTYEVRAFATVNGVAYRGSLTRAVTGTHEYVFLIDLKYGSFGATSATWQPVEK